MTLHFGDDDTPDVIISSSLQCPPENRFLLMPRDEQQRVVWSGPTESNALCLRNRRVHTLYWAWAWRTEWQLWGERKTRLPRWHCMKLLYFLFDLSIRMKSTAPLCISTKWPPNPSASQQPDFCSWASNGPRVSQPSPPCPYKTR